MTGRKLSDVERWQEKIDSLKDSQDNSQSAMRTRWIFNGRTSRRTVNRRFSNARFRVRRPIKRPLLTICHKAARLQWVCDHMRWNIRSWQIVHWSDESRFMLNPVDGRIRVWRQRNTAFLQEHIVGAAAFDGGGVTVLGCFLLSCKIDLYFLEGTLTRQMYRDQILHSLVVTQFDCHL